MKPREYQVMYEAEDRHWWYRSLHELILRFVRREYLRKGPLDCLDAGCGTGGLLARLAPFGRIAGCDASPAAVAFCHRRGLAGVTAADLNDSALPPAAYDVITLIDVLCHGWVRDRRALAERLFAALKPGGVLIANDPAFACLRGTHDRAVCIDRRFRRRDYRALFASAGFAVERATYRLPSFLLPIWIVRAAGRLARRDGSRDEVASDVVLPPPVVNAALLALARFDHALLRVADLPFGSSVFVVARKPA